MTNAIKIRQALMDDARALAQIEQLAFDPKQYGKCLSIAQFRHFIRSDTSSLGVAVNDAGEVEGYALLLFRKGGRSGRFYSLAVLPDTHDVGLGRILFAWAEAEVQRRGAIRIILEIREDNRVLLERYRRLGYRQFQTLINYYPDGAAAIRMEKQF